jgi:uncharacterized protein (DUF302 family)
MTPPRATRVTPKEPSMPLAARSTALAALLALLLTSPAALAQSVPARDDGVVRVRSVHSQDETVARLKRDIAAKGIAFFSEIDQSQLAAGAGVQLTQVRRSTLLVFGNPPLGTQFLNARPEAGLDWPVRLLVQEDTQGRVWATYTDFAWIARRHGIDPATPSFKTASGVIASIASSVAGQ